MKKIIYLFILSIGALLTHNSLQAQGCVAVRNMSSSCSMAFDSTLNNNKSLQVSLNYRFFKSFRHFTGDHEDTERVEENTNVINHDNSVIIGASYTINKRWAVSAAIPFLYIDRSSRPKDENGQRLPMRKYTTGKGLGDIRIMGYYAVVPNSEKGNLTVGLGFKLPTGNYNYQDAAYSAGTYVIKPVDQSIQPGDGGFGTILEVNFFRKIFEKTFVYGNGLYMFNPRNTNGTLTNRSNPFEAEMSVADQFFFRTGFTYTIKNLQASLGGRLEGIPVRDLIGKSDGFRRPGYIISLEPSLLYTLDRHSFGVNFPIALKRNRTQSVADKRYGEQEGETKHGDAAFADWLISVTYAFRL